METNRDDYRKKVEAQLDIWSAKLDVLKAKADKASAESKIELRKQVDELHELQATAKEYVARLATASGEAWTEIKEELDGAWTKLSTTIEATWNKLVH